jgi:hypothetical protein
VTFTERGKGIAGRIIADSEKSRVRLSLSLSLSLSLISVFICSQFKLGETELEIRTVRARKSKLRRARKGNVPLFVITVGLSGARTHNYPPPRSRPLPIRLPHRSATLPPSRLPRPLPPLLQPLSLRPSPQQRNLRRHVLCFRRAVVVFCADGPSAGAAAEAQLECQRTARGREEAAAGTEGADSPFGAGHTLAPRNETTRKQSTFFFFLFCFLQRVSRTDGTAGGSGDWWRGWHRKCDL